MSLDFQLLNAVPSLHRPALQRNGLIAKLFVCLAKTPSLNAQTSKNMHNNGAPLSHVMTVPFEPSKENLQSLSNRRRLWEAVLHQRKFFSKESSITAPTRVSKKMTWPILTEESFDRRLTFLHARKAEVEISTCVSCVPIIHIDVTTTNITEQKLSQEYDKHEQQQEQQYEREQLSAQQQQQHHHHQESIYSRVKLCVVWMPRYDNNLIAWCHAQRRTSKHIDESTLIKLAHDATSGLLALRMLRLETKEKNDIASTNVSVNTGNKNVNKLTKRVSIVSPFANYRNKPFNSALSEQWIPLYFDTSHVLVAFDGDSASSSSNSIQFVLTSSMMQNPSYLPCGLVESINKETYRTLNDYSNVANFPFYSPEQVVITRETDYGKCDTASEVWALGMAVYALACLLPSPSELTKYFLHGNTTLKPFNHPQLPPHMLIKRVWREMRRQSYTAILSSVLCELLSQDYRTRPLLSTINNTLYDLDRQPVILRFPFALGGLDFIKIAQPGNLQLNPIRCRYITTDICCVCKKALNKRNGANHRHGTGKASPTWLNSCDGNGLLPGLQARGRMRMCYLYPIITGVNAEEQRKYLRRAISNHCNDSFSKLHERSSRAVSNIINYKAFSITNNTNNNNNSNNSNDNDYISLFNNVNSENELEEPVSIDVATLFQLFGGFALYDCSSKTTPQSEKSKFQYIPRVYEVLVPFPAHALRDNEASLAVLRVNFSAGLPWPPSCTSQLKQEHTKQEYKELDQQLETERAKESRISFHIPLIFDGVNTLAKWYAWILPSEEFVLDNGLHWTPSEDGAFVFGFNEKLEPTPLDRYFIATSNHSSTMRYKVPRTVLSESAFRHRLGRDSYYSTNTHSSTHSITHVELEKDGNEFALHRPSAFTSLASTLRRRESQQMCLLEMPSSNGIIEDDNDTRLYDKGNENESSENMPLITSNILDEEDNNETYNRDNKSKSGISSNVNRATKYSSDAFTDAHRVTQEIDKTDTVLNNHRSKREEKEVNAFRKNNNVQSNYIIANSWSEGWHNTIPYTLGTQRTSLHPRYIRALQSQNDQCRSEEECKEEEYYEEENVPPQLWQQQQQELRQHRQQSTSSQDNAKREVYQNNELEEYFYDNNNNIIITDPKKEMNNNYRGENVQEGVAGEDSETTSQRHSRPRTRRRRGSKCRVDNILYDQVQVFNPRRESIEDTVHNEERRIYSNELHSVNTNAIDTNNNILASTRMNNASRNATLPLNGASNKEIRRKNRLNKLSALPCLEIEALKEQSRNEKNNYNSNNNKFYSPYILTNKEKLYNSNNNNNNINNNVNNNVNSTNNDLIFCNVNSIKSKYKDCSPNRVITTSHDNVSAIDLVKPKLEKVKQEKRGAASAAARILANDNAENEHCTDYDALDHNRTVHSSCEVQHDAKNVELYKDKTEIFTTSQPEAATQKLSIVSLAKNNSNNKSDSDNIKRLQKALESFIVLGNNDDMKKTNNCCCTSNSSNNNNSGKAVSASAERAEFVPLTDQIIEQALKNIKAAHDMLKNKKSFDVENNNVALTEMPSPIVEEKQCLPSELYKLRPTEGKSSQESTCNSHTNSWEANRSREHFNVLAIANDKEYVKSEHTNSNGYTDASVEHHVISWTPTLDSAAAPPIIANMSLFSIYLVGKCYPASCIDAPFRSLTFIVTETGEHGMMQEPTKIDLTLQTALQLPNSATYISFLSNVIPLLEHNHSQTLSKATKSNCENHKCASTLLESMLQTRSVNDANGTLPCTHVLPHHGFAVFNADGKVILLLTLRIALCTPPVLQHGEFVIPLRGLTPQNNEAIVMEQNMPSYFSVDKPVKHNTNVEKNTAHALCNDDMPPLYVELHEPCWMAFDHSRNELLFSDVNRNYWFPFAITKTRRAPSISAHTSLSSLQACHIINAGNADIVK